MAERATSGDQLGRILWLLPAASREGGITLSEAAAELDVPVATVQRDLGDVSARAFYHPAGSADEIQILLESNHLKIFAGNKFTRPCRLTLREALALSIGLRAVAAEAEAAGEHRDTLLALAARLDAQLAVTPSRDFWPSFSVTDPEGDPAGLRALLREATRDGRRCRILYLRAEGSEPSDREIDPYCLVYGSGRWYVLGHCGLRGDVRAFRLDRILEAAAMDVRFEIPEDFDPAEWLGSGRVFRAATDGEVRVRYSRRIAAWVREKGPCEELEDGSVAVRFPAADPVWAVRHVLQYGPEAEVLDPDSVRELVVEAARSLCE